MIRIRNISFQLKQSISILKKNKQTNDFQGLLPS